MNNISQHNLERNLQNYLPGSGFLEGVSVVLLAWSAAVETGSRHGTSLTYTDQFTSDTFNTWSTSMMGSGLEMEWPIVGCFTSVPGSKPMSFWVRYSCARRKGGAKVWSMSIRMDRRANLQ